MAWRGGLYARAVRRLMRPGVYPWRHGLQPATRRGPPVGFARLRRSSARSSSSRSPMRISSPRATGS